MQMNKYIQMFQGIDLTYCIHVWYEDNLHL